MDFTIYGAELWDIANKQINNTVKCTKTHGWFGVPLAIEGKITNNSLETVRDGRVEFKLFDREGYKIGEATDACDNIGPGETWHYKARITGEGCATFELAGIHW
jgi:hypothetical protein